MAQATCVPNPIRALITGASPQTSTIATRRCEENVARHISGHPPRLDASERAVHAVSWRLA